LVGRSVLPLARAVGGLAVFLRGDDLALAARAGAGDQDLVDLAPLGLGSGLARAPLERAEHASFDDGLESVGSEWLGAQDRQPLVAPCPGGAYQPMVAPGA